MGIPSGEMPMEAVLPGDVELCEECAKKGVQLIEAEKDKNGKVVPTGRFFVVSDDFVTRCLDSDEALVQRIIEARKAFISTELADAIEQVHKELGGSEVDHETDR